MPAPINGTPDLQIVITWNKATNQLNVACIPDNLPCLAVGLAKQAVDVITQMGIKKELEGGGGIVLAPPGARLPPAGRG